jgi:deoxyribose-phosphate aldolase
METREILSRTDHTLLVQTATWQESRGRLRGRDRLSDGFRMYPPSFVKRAAVLCKGPGEHLTVIGFPTAYNTTQR